MNTLLLNYTSYSETFEIKLDNAVSNIGLLKTVRPLWNVRSKETRFRMFSGQRYGTI